VGANVLVQEIIGARSRTARERIDAALSRTSNVGDSPSAQRQCPACICEQRGFFKQEGLDMRIVVIKPHLATATLLSSFLHETKFVEWRCSG
jgi:hypothetical protein